MRSAGEERAKVRFVEDGTSSIVLEVVDNETAGFLVLNDNYTTGWTARINGQPAPIFRANVDARGVPLPARPILTSERPGARCCTFSFPWAWLWERSSLFFQNLSFARFSSYHSDTHALHYPLRELAAKELAGGQIPLWDPYLSAAIRSSLPTSRRFSYRRTSSISYSPSTSHSGF